MSAAPETEMPLIGAPDVERMRIFVKLWIVVRGRE